MSTEMATITAKGQITIPKGIRQALGIERRDRLVFLLEDDRLILIPVRHRPLGELYGVLPATRPYPGHQAIRQEVRHERGERLARGDA
ncbi:MAG: AbrB/MazE/SpoVT family DNA-binding domain-containing protein [Anaerolineae bacterium]|nr:AbrB/MazE/SpoVT family DNA-binding domain-containing protein [Anaerolineae bacterium]